MKHSKTDTEGLSGIDLTPMLDVVFIMLIFFIVTASFVKTTGVEVDKPNAVQAKAQKNIKLLLAINADNQLWVDKKRVDIRKVNTYLADLQATYPNGALVIQADENADIKTLTQIVHMAKEAGIVNVSVATKPNS